MIYDQGKLLHPKISPEMLGDYEVYLRDEERSANTIAKYVRDLRAFFVCR